MYLSTCLRARRGGRVVLRSGRNSEMLELFTLNLCDDMRETSARGKIQNAKYRMPVDSVREGEVLRDEERTELRLEIYGIAVDSTYWN